MSKVEPPRNRYVGHRYVPKIFGEWDKRNSYEGLSIVTYEGTSYTSKQHVPVGVDIKNEKYWVVTGNYNAQVEYYRKEVIEMEKRVNESLKDVNKELDDTKDKLDDNITKISLDEYKELFEGNDITKALLQAIHEAPDGSEIVLNPNKTYEISEQNLISEVIFSIGKPVTVDFNHSLVLLKTNGKIVFDLLFVGGERNFNSRVNLKNYFFKTPEGYIPMSVFRTNGAINSSLHGNMAECKTSHSLIWNWKGYGTNIRGELRRNDTPRTIYLSNSASAVHSFAFDIDVDITGNTGIGIESEGANGNIAGIIESCQGGGYFYNGVHISSGVNINVHFEENEQFDAKIGVPEYVVDGSRNAGVTNIIGSFALFKGEGNNLLFGSGQQINVIGSMGFKAGAIDDTVNKATTVITEIGNFASAGLLSEEDKEIVGYVGILRRRAYLEELNVNSGDLQSKDRLRLRPFNKTALTVTDKEVLPPHLGIELGGEFNRFSTIYGRYINLISPDGSEFRIQVDDEGNLSAIRL